jgi:peptidoglycan/xylan/chitin deacetylase (PgdA/CDA1 family)
MSPSVRSAARRRVLRLAVPTRTVPDDGTFALTFDDGPDPHFTTQVLDVLAAHDAPATFFLVGHRAERHPELVRRMVTDGHGIGSHTWSHPELSTLGWPRLVAECRRGRRAVERAAGFRVRPYRPPKGHFDPRGALAARLASVDPWLWSRDPSDWRPGVSAELLMERLEDLRSGDVVLLHDGLEQPPDEASLDRSSTVAVLEPLLALAAERGLRPVRLDQPCPP